MLPRYYDRTPLMVCLLALGCGPGEALPGAGSPGVPAAARPPDLPVAVANNAVVSVHTRGETSLFSFLGLDASKSWDGVTSIALRWDVGDAAWREIESTPGPPRLAATAQVVGGLIYVFGGYTVAADGAERSVPDVAVYDPSAESWSAAAPMPIPVDDAVSGVWNDSLIFLISGWHDGDNEAAVQIYDPATDSWRQATPIPGPPVFGHTGGISGNTIVYVDGARVDRDPRGFSLEPSSWRGEIDPTDPGVIEWSRLPDHPGAGVYRGAAIGVDGRIVFVGGSDNPYNYDGHGYDGRVSEPTGAAFAWDTRSGGWVVLEPPETATMDHRGLVRLGEDLYTVGGMISGQRVTASVIPLP